MSEIIYIFVFSLNLDEITVALSVVLQIPLLALSGEKFSPMKMPVEDVLRLFAGLVAGHVPGPGCYNVSVECKIPSCTPRQ